MLTTTRGAERVSPAQVPFAALSAEQMYDRLVASDAAFNGVFVVGVSTTGIYCLPACRARKPKAEHVSYYSGPEEARLAGFRACKKCRPDDFYRGFDPDRAALVEVITRLRSDPSGVPDVETFAAHVGVGLSKLAELCRREYHAAPSELLQRAKVAKASQLLTESREAIAEIAYGAGWSSLSSYYATFERLQGMSPGAYRRLVGAREFRLATPATFQWERLRRYWGRDPQSASEKVVGETLAIAVRLVTGPALLHLTYAGGALFCRINTPSDDPRVAVAAHRLVLRMMGLEMDPRLFEKRIGASPWRALVAGREGLTIPQTANLWDGLVWVVAGQQVSLAVAFALRRRLTETYGEKLADGLYAPPDAQRVAQAEPEELWRLHYSRAKATYILGAARAVSAGLDLEALHTATAPEAEAQLGSLHGLGPWSVNYLRMRALGFVDCVPVGDAALVRSLATFFGLDQRPDARRTLELMANFAPFRSLATFHLWSMLEKKT